MIHLLTKKLHVLADEKTAAILARFFKTAPGEYGAGDKFLGIRVPTVRAVAKEFYSDLSLSDLKKILASPWHEERLCALLILVLQYQTADLSQQKNIYNFYLRERAAINNWDLVDLSTAKIVGAYLLSSTKKEQKILFSLAKEPSIWARRIAVVATYAFICQNIFAPTLELVEFLINDKEDLMHKASGWMLREIAKRDQTLVEHFLTHHYTKLPRTTLRYAIERFPAPLRQFFLHGDCIEKYFK